MQQLVSPEVFLCDIISCHMIFLQNINKMSPLNGGYTTLTLKEIDLTPVIPQINYNIRTMVLHLLIYY